MQKNSKIHDEYFEYCRKYSEEYGEKTVILLECGMFFEMYAIINDKISINPNIQTVCDLLNIILSRKNKSITEVSYNNPLMAGFPSQAVSKYTPILLSNNYTVVLVKQVTPPPNPKREVTEILSPSMQLQPNTSDGNYLVCSYWDIIVDKYDKRYLNVGISGIDVSTGNTFVYEIYSDEKDPSYTIDEFIRCIYLYQPKEIIFIGHNLINDEKNMIKNSISNCKSHILWDIIKDKEFENIVYQNKILEKIFENKTMLKPIEMLDLEKYVNVRVCFCYMIQFVYEHNPTLISNLKKPLHVNIDNSNCIIEYNSAIQLQIIGSNLESEKPLMSILNRCSTAFGRRNFKEKMLQPIHNIEKLNKIYDDIEDMIKDKKCEIVSKTLRDVLDLERIARRIYLGSYYPMEWCGFDEGLSAIIKIGTYLDKTDILNVATNLRKSYENILNLDEANKYNLYQGIKSNIFYPDIHKEIDILQKQLDENRENLDKIAELFTEGAKVEFNETEGYRIVITKTRWEKFKKTELDLMNGYLKGVEAKPLSSSSSSIKLKHKHIESYSNNIIKYTELISVAVTKRYKEFLKKYADENINKIIELVELVSYVDIIANNARNAIEYNYKRPILLNDDKSFVATKGIRHPILERLNMTHEYVTNDIELSKDYNGLLLFGINASGKSSLMKAVGCNIIMAQTGMFVATNEMKLSPYRKIFTRITGMDNIYKGWSTYVVEMLELRNILQRCDKYSLVLGDELCSGTESISALAIVSAGIKTLVDNNSSFIFATHLHDLPKIKVIQEMENKNEIKLAHLHIELDENGTIIYDRKMRDGSGNSLYGLEVCRGLNMPQDFLKCAHDIRCEIEGISPLIQDDKKSRYNSNVFMGECSLCKKQSTETHHIKEQHQANEQGYFEDTGMHKNKEFNLIPVCEECHQKIHKNEIIIEGGYVQTSKGTKLKKVINNEQKR